MYPEHLQQIDYWKWCRSAIEGRKIVPIIQCEKPQAVPVAQPEPLMETLVEIALEQKPEQFKPYIVKRETPTLEDIFEEARKFYRLNKTEFGSTRRRAPLVLARQVAMYLSRELTLKSFPDIGRYIDRDHTSIIHGCRAIQGKLTWDDRLVDEVQLITIKINERVAARNAMVRT